MTKVGILTGGGDCPGLNAVIRAATLVLADQGVDVVGVHAGWRGMVGHDFRPLTRDIVSNLISVGGTILGSSRTNPYKEPQLLDRVKSRFEELDALIAIGGEDTLGVAAKLHNDFDLPVVGVPKTIDNDLPGTDRTFGFDTAVSIATEAIDRLRTTAESHNRTMVVEVMGRHAGWIAVEAGLAGGAHAVLLPEFPMSIEAVAEIISARRDRGRFCSIVVVSEGWPYTSDDPKAKKASEGDVERDAFGHVRLGGIGEHVANALADMTGMDTRATVLGYTQRGGTPTSYDRLLATRYGTLAARLVLAKDFGKMASLRGSEVVPAPLADALGPIRTVPRELYDLTLTLVD